jgi:hypothetical protein
VTEWIEPHLSMTAKVGHCRVCEEIYEQALHLYERIPELYSIGRTHQRLARIAAAPDERNRHLQAARDTWLSIDRPDLVKELGQGA